MAALLKVMHKGTPDLEKFLAYYQDTVTEAELLNTKYSEGDNAVQLAARQQMWDQWFVLMQHGGTSEDIVDIMLRDRRGDMIQRLMENVFAPTISKLVDREKNKLIAAVLSGSLHPGLSDLVAAGPQPAGEEDTEEAANEEEVSKYLSMATALFQALERLKGNQSGMYHWPSGEPYLGLAVGVWAVARGEEKMKADIIVKTFQTVFKVKIPRDDNLKENSIKKNISAWNLAHKEMKIEDADVDDMTSDKLLYMEKGNMTLMEVQISKDNKSVVRLRARYGEDEFGAWHVTGDGEEGEVSVVDVAGNGGGNDVIHSYHHTTTGSLLGLVALPVSGKVFGWYGDESVGDNTKYTLYFGSRRGQKLAYLTSRKRGDRFNINCHWDKK